MDDDVERGTVEERRHLTGLAFRMLGTIAEAEDVVSETYARWYRLDEAERAAIVVPRAWLTRVASRIALDALSSARARRERYVGQWLPEPVPDDRARAFTAHAGTADPADRATLDDEVSTALLLVLEAMTPAERVAFVLHDVFGVRFDEIGSVVGRSTEACRQLAAAARRRVRADRRRPVERRVHDDVVRAFAAACRSGDLPGLAAVLDPAVVLRSDGGGVVRAALNPVTGADRVSRFLVGVHRKYTEVELAELRTPDGLGLARWSDGRIVGVYTLRVVDGAVTDVWLMANPAKLSLWNE